MDDMKNPDGLPDTSEKPVAVKTIIADSFTIEGEIEAKEDTLIQGRVTGRIVVEDHTVHIGNQAKVSGEVFAKAIIVEGKFDGQLKATATVDLRQRAEVEGTILAPKVGMEKGCQFNGEVKMDASALSKPVARARGEKSS